MTEKVNDDCDREAERAMIQSWVILRAITSIAFVAMLALIISVGSFENMRKRVFQLLLAFVCGVVAWVASAIPSVP